jgi:transcriptional regulator with XRE-family HTH domain
MEDARFGRIVRALRHRLELPQREVGRRAQSSQNLVSRIERGRVEAVSVGRLRRVLAVFDAELVLFVRWRGGEVDRLLDRAHAGLGERVSAILSDLGWEVVAEVSYAEFGERGSIDLLAWHAATSTLLVIEIKSELTSIEETLRRHDAKTRLAPKIASDRFGWQANASHACSCCPTSEHPDATSSGTRSCSRARTRCAAGSYAAGWRLPGRKRPPGREVDRPPAEDRPAASCSCHRAMACVLDSRGVRAAALPGGGRAKPVRSRANPADPSIDDYILGSECDLPPSTTQARSRRQE